MVEHSAVNRVVVGSSPTRGAKKARRHQCLRAFFIGKGTYQSQKENKYLQKQA